MNWYMLRTVGLWLLLMAACRCKMANSGSKDNKGKVDSKSKLLIYIQQSSCLGKCPQYEATFYTGHRMVYKGVKYMPVVGSYEYLLPAEMTKNLIFEAVKLNLKTVPDSMPYPPDVPVTHLRIVMDGKERRIVGWTGSNESFKNFVNLVYKEVRAMTEDQQGVPYLEAKPGTGSK